MPPKQRVTPGLGISPSPGRPSARPRDSFVQFTGNAASGSLRELASSLSRFGEQGSRFAAEQQRKQQEQQTQAGKTAFLKELEEQNSTAKALAALELRPQQSKFFRFGVESAAGKADAMRARDFFFATKSEELDAAVTLEEFDELAQEALDEFRENGDDQSEAFENGFFPGYIAVMENARFEFARGLDGKLSGQRLEDFELTNLAEMGLYLRGGGERAGLASAITAQLDEMQQSENPLLYPGMQEIVVQNLKALADAMDDTSIIEIAQSINIGPAGPTGERISLWTRFRGGSDGLEAGIDDVIQRQNLRRNAEIAEERRADQIAFKAIEDEVMDLILDGEGARTGMIAQLLAKGDGIDSSATNVLRRAIDTREAFTDNTVLSVYDGIQSDIWNGRGSLQAILSARGQLSKGDARALLADLRSYDSSLESGSTSNSLLKDSRITGFISELRGRFAVGIGGTMTQDQGNRRAAAISQYKREIAINADILKALSEPELLEWLASHANVAFDAHVGEIQREIGGPGGFEDTPEPAARMVIATQPELVSAFGRRTDVQVTQWAAESANTMDFGDAPPPGLEQFRQRWNTMRPDAPLGTQQFLDAWALYRTARDGGSE